MGRRSINTLQDIVIQFFDIDVDFLILILHIKIDVSKMMSKVAQNLYILVYIFII